MKLTKKEKQELRVKLDKIQHQINLLKDYFNTGVKSPELTQLLLQFQQL